MAEFDRPLGANWPGWVKTLAAPLFVISLLAHGLLLVIPVPSSSAPELEEEASAEEEFVDLLSISSLPTSEPEPEPELPSTPPPEAAPPPAPAAAAPSAPTAPTQPVVPEVYPDTPPRAAAPADALPPAEEAFTAAPEPAPVAFVQGTEVVEIFDRLTRGSGDSDFDSTETSFPAIAYLTRGGISEWSPAEQSCFFDQISADDYRLKPNAPSLRFLTRNEQYIRNEDVPRTFQGAEYQVNELPEGFCDRTLFQVLREGQPFLFISVVGIGVGARGQQGGGLVIIWSSDPRAS